MSRFVNPRPQFFDGSGDPIPGGKLFIYDSGTTTLKTSYVDVNQSVANTNPIILDADGRVPSIFFDGSARVVLRDADDVLIWDIDPVGGSNLTGPFSEWSPEITYDLGDIVVTSNGDLYRSLQAANADNEPSTSPTFWEELEFISIWNANVTYSINATVKASNGLFYRSLVNGNLGNNPPSSSTEWGAPVDTFVLGLPDGGTITGTDSVAVNNKYLCDFTSTSYTITLPAAPTAGDVILLTKFGTGTLTLGLNGLKFNGSTSNPQSSIEGQTLLRYTGAARGWVEL